MMSIATRAIQMQHDADPRQELLDAVAPKLTGITLAGARDVLIAIYIRPEKTLGGLYLAPKTRDEDRFQGKVGLILAMGSRAFLDGTLQVVPRVGDWVAIKPSDSWQFLIGDVPCRVVDDTFIRLVLDAPDSVM